MKSPSFSIVYSMLFPFNWFAIFFLEVFVLNKFIIYVGIFPHTPLWLGYVELIDLKHISYEIFLATSLLNIFVYSFLRSYAY